MPYVIVIAPERRSHGLSVALAARRSMKSFPSPAAPVFSRGSTTP